MKKRLKNVLCLIFVVCLMGVQVTAAVVDPIMPCWETVRTAECLISFSGTNGSVSCTVYGKAGTTRIEGSLILYEDGVEIEEWPISTTTRVSIYDSFTGERGNTYTLELDVDVTCNGTVERVQKDVSRECP